MAISVNGKINTGLMEEIEQMVENKLQTFQKISIFLEIEEGMSFPAALKDVKFHLKFKGRFDKVAIVTERELLQKFMEVKDFFLDSEIKTFEKEDRIAAMNWVM